MNCSESRRLQRLLSRLLQELRGGGGAAAPSNNGSSSASSSSGGGAWQRHGGAGDDAYLYILLIMIFYACLAGGLILAYTRSRTRQSKHDPYHLYIERDWTDGGGLAAAATHTRPGPGEAAPRESHSSADSERP